MSTDPARPSTLRHSINQTIGILVFLAGVALLLMVFYLAYHLYLDLGAETLGAQPLTQAPVVSGAPAARLPVAEAVRASPSKSPPLLNVLATFGARLVMLLALGWLAALLAGKGAALARQAVPRE